MKAASTSNKDKTTQKKKITALDELIRAASLLNPKQFQLPRELSMPIMFPGMEKGWKIHVLGEHYFNICFLLYLIIIYFHRS